MSQRRKKRLPYSRKRGVSSLRVRVYMRMTAERDQDLDGALDYLSRELETLADTFGDTYPGVDLEFEEIDF